MTHNQIGGTLETYTISRGLMVATIGAVFVWSGGSPDTSYADEDEKLQELIQKMEEAVNKSGPEQSVNR